MAGRRQGDWLRVIGVTLLNLRLSMLPLRRNWQCSLDLKAHKRAMCTLHAGSSIKPTSAVWPYREGHGVLDKSELLAGTSSNTSFEVLSNIAGLV
jgi:hypothetical protein